MIKYTTGNILDSKTKGIVNTVNCDGFMGKGIAYQFKLRFPKNNLEYVKQCKSKNVRIGKVLSVEEENKIILNFPTKDNWRKKSEYKFIEDGLDSLIQKIEEYHIESIAIPPLGCGNGGLNWERVKGIIEDKLKKLSEKIEIILYEPIFHNDEKNFDKKIKKAPVLSSSHLLLMLFKKNLKKFNKTRLQKSAYLNNILSGQNYFKFEAFNFGPYAHSIEILSREIKEYQDFYNITTEEAYLKALQYLVSKNLNSKVDTFRNSMKKTLNIVNHIENDSDLELLTTLIFLIENSNHGLEKDLLINKVHEWNEHKKKSFPKYKIENAISEMLQMGIIELSLYNTYQLNHKYYKNSVSNN